MLGVSSKLERHVVQRSQSTHRLRLTRLLLSYTHHEGKRSMRSLRFGYACGLFLSACLGADRVTEPAGASFVPLSEDTPDVRDSFLRGDFVGGEPVVATVRSVRRVRDYRVRL